MGYRYLASFDRDRNCQACSNRGWQFFTESEHELIAKLDSCHQEVFGSPYFDTLNTVHWGEVPSTRYCPKCTGLEGCAEEKSRFAQWRLHLRALETLVSRVRQGESFDPRAAGYYPTGGKGPVKLAKSPPPGQTHARKKRSPIILSDELTQLASLRKSGALTEEEFKLAKQKLLGSTSPNGRKRQNTKPDIYEEPPNLPEENDPIFSIGDRVSHPNFGTGRVISISGSGCKTEIEINFH